MDLINIGMIVGLICLIFSFDLYFDKRRIRASAERLGYKDIEIRWAPFAPGAVFSRGRHYYVSYTDKYGDQQFSYCKTSLLTGVYWRHEKDVYAGTSCMVALVFYLLIFLGLCGGIVMAVQWVR